MGAKRTKTRTRTRLLDKEAERGLHEEVETVEDHEMGYLWATRLMVTVGTKVMQAWIRRMGMMRAEGGEGRIEPMIVSMGRVHLAGRDGGRLRTLTSVETTMKIWTSR